MRLGSAVAVLLMFAAAPAGAASTRGAYLGDLSWPEALNTSISKAGSLPLSIAESGV